PKIADYPFTTLKPNLGVVGLSDGRSMVIADIPGIIEGAAEGKGLGTQFLRHIERTRTLALMVPSDSEDPQATYELLRSELLSHDAALEQIPHCLVITKADLRPEDDREWDVDAPEAWGSFVVSSVSGEGLGDFLQGLWARVEEEKKRERVDLPDPFPELEEWRP
ncbi:MAG: 50S ribosome-binding GTPase, partial [Gemmatimonadetes bacterium]|nr:50S ribosome-binding GTPase [Gemmatimonadota bacterium]